MTEEGVLQANIRLSLPDNVRLFRNNVGKIQARDGRWIDFGLCVGSSDLIGLTTVTIGPEHVGQHVAIFTALEVKTQTGRVTPEQQNFIDTLKVRGARAGIARSVDDAEKIIRGE